MPLNECLFSAGISGVLMKRLTNETLLLPNTAVQCVTWYHEAKQMKDEIKAYSEKMPKCPCDLTSMSFDPWWKWKTVEELDRECYYIWNTVAFGTYGKVRIHVCQF